ncbi:MAG TPA: molybdopterin-dependent oxidoreductase [Candidatus Dormibacteraeota bacterium]|jgi:DMSO/TMAO reductase YedYZ molybdopterin-dependent catalytic subunit|nr:molybdopterin-dependent oxidoreductase [Candidatus Dormibacteraeota bacterium]
MDSPFEHAPDELLSARPIGRRIFLGMLGVGAAGLAFTELGLRNDAAGDGLPQAVPLGSTPIDSSESSIGQHPNLVTTERFRYYSVGYIPAYDPKKWNLRLDGEGVKGNLVLTLDQLKAFPNVAIKATFRCVTGWRVRDCVWRGVRVRDVVDAVGQNGKAKFVTFYSGDGVYTDSLTIAQARSDDAILCWELNGAPLIREQGMPLRLIYPDMYGYKNVKWVRRLEVKSGRDVGFWEQQGWEIEAYIGSPSTSSG